MSSKKVYATAERVILRELEENKGLSNAERIELIDKLARIVMQRRKIQLIWARGRFAKVNGAPAEDGLLPVDRAGEATAERPRGETEEIGELLATLQRESAGGEASEEDS